MTRKGVKTGAKLPSSYDTGEPAVNFYLAILAKAKRDKAQMWLDYKRTELYQPHRRNISAEAELETAWWVSNYLTDML